MLGIIRMALFVFLLFLIASTSRAEVFVTPAIVTEEVTNSYVVAAGRHEVVPLPSVGDSKGAFKITISADNAVYKDITAYLVDADNMRLFSQGSPYQGMGFQKAKAPFTIQGAMQTPGPYYLILDNGYALFIAKKLKVSVKAAFPMDEKQQQIIKTSLESFYANLKKLIVFPDFNIRIEPCGQTNAFSDTFTSGDIHFCSEMADHLTKTKNTGAFLFIFLHELGHSLLGLWGMPGNNNEDIADEFATYLMMQGSSNITTLLEQSLDFWRNRDSMGEAMQMVAHGDRHSLSVQRIRNIQENMKMGDAFIKRWNREIYPHMTPEYLNQIISNPKSFSDVELAKEILKERSKVN